MMKLFLLNVEERKMIRQFGWLMGGVFAVVFGLVLPWTHEFKTDLWSYQYGNLKFPLWPWVVSITFWSFALIFPLALKPVYKVWMLIGHVLGWINTRIILAILFYMLIFPMGLLMRLFGNDPMHKSYDKKLNTYRVIHPVPDKTHVEKPY